MIAPDRRLTSKDQSLSSYAPIRLVPSIAYWWFCALAILLAISVLAIMGLGTYTPQISALGVFKVGANESLILTLPVPHQSIPRLSPGSHVLITLGKHRDELAIYCEGTLIGLRHLNPNDGSEREKYEVTIRIEPEDAIRIAAVVRSGDTYEVIIGLASQRIAYLLFGRAQLKE